MNTVSRLLPTLGSAVWARRIIDRQTDAGRLCGACLHGTVWEACYCEELAVERLFCSAAMGDVVIAGGTGVARR
jgi:hypothetical protein